jgi:heme-degrading monooxygenase HmoA
VIATFVTFRFGDDFNDAKVRKIAEGAKGKFEGMPGLRSKAFTLRPEKKEAVNVYVWESEAAAKAFFTEQLLEGVTALYGVRPSVEFAEIAALVDNHSPDAG